MPAQQAGLKSNQPTMKKVWRFSEETFEQQQQKNISKGSPDVFGSNEKICLVIN